MPSVEAVHYRRGSQRPQRHAPPRHLASGKDSCPDSSSQKAAAKKLFGPACTDSVPSFSCFRIASMLISNGDQKMKPHTQCRDLPRRPAPLRSAPLGLPAVHRLRATGRDSRLTNRKSQISICSSLVTSTHSFRSANHTDSNRLCAIKNVRNSRENTALNFSNRPKSAYLRARFARLRHPTNHRSQLAAHVSLIASQILELHLTCSQQTRKHFLIATFFAIWHILGT